MALHGSVAVNGAEIARWSARRVAPGGWPEADDLCTYECEVTTQQGEGMRATLEHRYGDGALALLRKILDTHLGG